MEPAAVLELVIAGAPSVMVKVITRSSVPVAFVADTVTLLVTTTVGVPEIRPVLVFKLSPAGSALEL